ncbi:protein spaetzle-like [Zootermopsis nevadensis]|uniref:Protein spaetzle n=1 Tax=Zootermopsis nevadensis TaxID=136037 RepID=A0A067R4F3_ZOONE|nr:protein spaetzle-like [Zootermopsis nevadensis]KDR17074.1 Protein spaetzle [Zootermopsis nevadensis]
MPMPTTVSVLLVMFILVDASAGYAAWRKTSPHFCKRGHFHEDKQHEGRRWRRVSDAFNPKPRDIKNNATFIENVSDYPLKMLLEILKKEGREHMDIFGTDSEIKETTIHSRIQPQETKLCPSLEQVVYPKLALNKDDEWKFVVNVGEDYVQGVRVETCGHLDKCSLSDSFPAGYTATCEQKYVFRRLLSVAEKGKPVVDEFRLPSCCACTIKGPS